MAGQLQAIARHNQYESLRELGSAGQVYRRSGNGQITDQAIHSAAAELNSSDFQDVVAGRSATFGHEIKLRKNSKESLKGIVAPGAGLTLH
jgi:hypothetical protein